MQGNDIRFTKTTLAGALAMALGGSLAPVPLEAAIITFSFGPGTTQGGLYDPIDLDHPRANEALFTALDLGTGEAVGAISYPYYGDPTWGYGLRTQIQGNLAFDTSNNSGSVSINPFFWLKYDAEFSNIAFHDAGVDPVTGHALVQADLDASLSALGNVYNYPTSLIWDIDGLLSAINAGLHVGDSITGGSLPASNDSVVDYYSQMVLSIGPALIATTSYDSVSPFTDDGIGGTQQGLFDDQVSVNLDFVTLHVTSITTVPVPAAVWLLGSGMLGLIALATRKKRAA